MTRTGVQAVPHQAGWTKAYQAEAKALDPILGPLLIRLEHIGSTAVPGLAAKPIIDLLMEVSSVTALDAVAGRLEQLGYQARGEFGIAGRRYFTRGEAPRTHNLHCFASGDAHLDRHRVFRDYLACHADVVAAYGALKLGLASRHPDDIDAYMDGKDAFVKRHEALALRWAEETRPPRH